MTGRGGRVGSTLCDPDGRDAHCEGGSSGSRVVLLGGHGLDVFACVCSSCFPSSFVGPRGHKWLCLAHLLFSPPHVFCWEGGECMPERVF